MSTTTAYTPAWYSEPLEAGFQPYYDDNDPKTWFAPGIPQGFTTLADLYVAWKTAGRPLIGALPDTTLTLRESGALLSAHGGKLFRQQATYKRIGVVNPEVSSYVMGNGSGVQSPFKQITVAVGGVISPTLNTWLELQGTKAPAISGTTFVIGSGNNYPMVTYRFMTDTLKLDLAFSGNGLFRVEIFIDGQRLDVGQPLNPATVQSWISIVFSTAKPRLIEVRTACGFGGVLVGPLYSVWKPAQATGPRLLVVGDSYVQAVGATCYNKGLYQALADELGIEDLCIDALSGTGYLNRATMVSGGGVAGNFNDRLASHVAMNPDILLVNNGGINDLYGGWSVADTITAITTYFRNARLALPYAKLVYVEPFSPIGFLAQYPLYGPLVAGVRDALKPYGVHIIDTWTSGPWLTGTGFTGRTLSAVTTNGTAAVAGAFQLADVGAKITGTNIQAGSTIVAVGTGLAALSLQCTGTGTVTATIDPTKQDGNSDAYITTDAFHPTDAGHYYLRRRMVVPLLRVLEAA